MTEGSPPRPKDLKNKPLIEAILEVRWKLESGPLPGMLRDPHYSLLIGRLSEKAKANFPHHEELPAASVPADLTPHIVQHRFRPAANGWPLIQVGPGVFTVNETQGYTWEGFEQLINKGILDLISSHPKPEALQFETLMLRYVNAIGISQQEDVLRFLSEKMSTKLALPPAIFADGNVRAAPLRVATEFVFPCGRPMGILQLKFSTGLKEKVPALIFEEWFVSSAQDVPRMPDGFGDWAATAHGVVEDTFFRLIAGTLEKEFSGDVETATKDLATTEVRNLVTSPAITYDVASDALWSPAGRWFRFFPAAVLSAFVSTASVLTDPRTVFAADSSVVLESLRRVQRGRRISLAEAREMALDAVRRADQRARIAAERESAEFLALFGRYEE